jgi:hypothetical protein
MPFRPGRQSDSRTWSRDRELDHRGRVGAETGWRSGEEQQRQAPRTLVRSDGTSLAELEEMAHEVGIEPALGGR